MTFKIEKDEFLIMALKLAAFLGQNKIGMNIVQDDSSV